MDAAVQVQAERVMLPVVPKPMSLRVQTIPSIPFFVNLGRHRNRNKRLGCHWRGRCGRRWRGRGSSLYKENCLSRTRSPFGRCTPAEASAGTGGTAAGAGTVAAGAGAGAVGFATATGMPGGAGDTGLT